MKGDKDIEGAGNIGPLSQQLVGEIDYTGLSPINADYDFAAAQDVDKVHAGPESVGVSLGEVQIDRGETFFSPKAELQRLRANYPFLEILPIPVAYGRLNLNVGYSCTLSIPQGVKAVRLSASLAVDSNVAAVLNQPVNYVFDGQIPTPTYLQYTNGSVSTSTGWRVMALHPNTSPVMRYTGNSNSITFSLDAGNFQAAFVDVFYEFYQDA